MCGFTSGSSSGHFLKPEMEHAVQPLAFRASFFSNLRVSRVQAGWPLLSKTTETDGLDALKAGDCLQTETFYDKYELR